MKPSTVLLIVAAAVLSAPQAFPEDVAVLYQGDFSGTGRPEGWIVCAGSSGADIEMSGNALKLTPGSGTDQAKNFIVCKFPAVELKKDGDFIAMTFSLNVKNAPAQNNNIRFGLFDSNGTPLDNDVTSPEVAALRDDRGFYFRLATHPDNNTDRVSRYYVSSGNGQAAALTSNMGAQRQLGGENLTGVFLNGQRKKVEMILTRQGEKVDFKVLFNGNVQTEGRVVEAPPTYRFDQAVFSIVHPDTSASISDFVIDSNGTRIN